MTLILALLSHSWHSTWTTSCLSSSSNPSQWKSSSTNSSTMSAAVVIKSMIILMIAAKILEVRKFSSENIFVHVLKNLSCSGSPGGLRREWVYECGWANQKGFSFHRSNKGDIFCKYFCTAIQRKYFQVDVYDQLVSTVPEPSRLKISRRVLRKLLQIRDKQRLKFRWRRHFCVKWNIFLTNIFSAGMEMEERGWLDDCLVEAESWNWFDFESVPSHDNCWPGVWRTWWTDCCESSVSRETIHLLTSPHSQTVPYKHN